jgi:hypothetical protein
MRSGRYLTNRFVAKLGHDAARTRVVFKSLHGGDDSSDNKVSIVRGITGDLGAYRLDVLDCLRCPENLGHRRSRRFASA